MGLERLLPAPEQHIFLKGTAVDVVQGSHFVGHYGKIVSNRMGVFFNAQIFKRSKT